MHRIVLDNGGGYPIELECRYMVPGLTMHDIMRIFESAESAWKPEDDLSANPSKWKNFRGVTAVIDAVVEVFVNQGTGSNG